MSYTALVLDQDSQSRLVAYFKPPVVPVNWNRFCHHMTINLGNPETGPAANLVGQTFELTATTFAEDSRVVAVGVESVVPSKNAIKHVTVAVNVSGGGKPKHSNELTNWTPLSTPISLRGTVQVVQ